MKKIIMLILCALCITACFGCNGNSSKDTSNDSSFDMEVGDETMDDIFG